MACDVPVWQAGDVAKGVLVDKGSLLLVAVFLGGAGVLILGLKR
jgi:hypothetical protein